MPSTVLQVALPRPLPQAFDYLPPAGEAAGADWIGCRVRVPFGRRALVGVVTGVGPAASGTPALKAVDARLDARPLLDGEAWDLLGFTARYYHAPFGEVWATALPGPLREGDPAPEVHPQRWRLTPSGLAALPTLRPGRPRRVAERLLVEGALEAASLDAAEAGSRDALRRLAERGLVEATHAPPPPRAVREPPELNDAQRAAASAIGAAKGFTPLLLEGVTGSGKTEVYLEAIRGCLARGRQALVLVPEIGLTGATLARLQAGLPVEVHAAHSGRSDGERARAFAAMASGAGRVLVGTRSAVFTPLPEAGLLVVDEEHDASYKQQDGVRYHARDLALVRGRSLGVPVVLGSATPSLESLK
ncbi:MAG: DEAD/DEAH box helicase, partial [Lysobacteraceae bacterium]